MVVTPRTILEGKSYAQLGQSTSIVGSKFIIIMQCRWDLEEALFYLGVSATHKLLYGRANVSE